jgi:hypothetical protein
MNKLITAAAISAILILTGCNSTTSTKTTVACEEDQPCWDCDTMGNKVCGEDLPKGVVLIPDSECPLFQPVCYDHLTPWAKGH